MSKISNILRQRVLAMVLLVMGVATTAFAVPLGQVLRSTTYLTFSGPCCFSFDESVAITEPATPVPVVVTWSATTGGTFEDNFAGLMVNGGPCQFYGSGSIPESGGGFASRTFQWIVSPSDGLQPGTNTFTLCGGGGGILADSAIINLFANSLDVRLSK